MADLRLTLALAFLAVGVVLLSACTMQDERGYETRVSLPVTGEVVFH
jgi:hypothetical protein